MRRLCLVISVIVLPLVACACGVLPQTVQLSPFSALIQFSENNTDYEGTLTVEDDRMMQIELTAPQSIQGLVCTFENGVSVLRFEDALVSLEDAEHIALAPTAMKALFEALSALFDTQQTLSPEGAVELSTSRGTATAVFSSASSVLQRVMIGDVTFTLENFDGLA